MKKLLLAAALVATATPALAWEEHTIDSINGDSIILDDGRVFEPSNGSDISGGAMAIPSCSVTTKSE